MAESEAMAERALRGVGDAELGEWRERGNRGVFHIRRRLADWEVKRYGMVVRDIRGTQEEQQRLHNVRVALEARRIR